LSPSFVEDAGGVGLAQHLIFDGGVDPGAAVCAKRIAAKSFSAGSTVPRELDLLLPERGAGDGEVRAVEPDAASSRTRSMSMELWKVSCTGSMRRSTA
jgi:hypothetical protein